jgi:hypothetical protein
MSDWKSIHAKQEKEEKERIRKRQENIDAMHREHRQRMTSSAPSQRTNLASLFSNPFRIANAGGGSGASEIVRLQSQLQQSRLQQSQLQSQLRVGTSANSQLMIERKLEELSQQIGAVAEALEQVQQNTAFNHEQTLDRLEGLRVQIRQESERLMRTMRTIRERSNCDLRDPRTYIYCIELIYKLLFKIFVFLCQLVFVVGNSFKRFLSYMPFPFSILVFIAYIFEIVLIMILFDRTMYVGTLGISHQEFIQHNALFERYSGAPEMISPRMALYEGFAVTITRLSSGLFFVLSSSYEMLLGDVIGMANGVTRHAARDVTPRDAIARHVVNPLVEKAKEQVKEKVAELANEQLGVMGTIPGKIGELAIKGAHGAKGLGQGAASLAGRVAEGVVEGISQRAERLSKIDPENVKDVARSIAEKLAEKSEGAYHDLRRFGSKLYGGSINKTKERKSKDKGNQGNKGHSKGRLTAKNVKYKMPNFTILTKKEQKEFDQTSTGKRIKELEKIMNDIDYSKIQPNPEMFHIIRFALNIGEELFPLFVAEFNESIKLAKEMKDLPVLNPNIIKQIKEVITL